MRCAVLCEPTSWYFRDLARAAAGRDELIPLSFRQLRSVIDSHGATRIYAGEIDLATVDAVIVRTMPLASLEQIIVRMDMLGRLEAAGQIVLNSPRSLETAIDKYLSLARLAAGGVLVPETEVCQSHDEAEAAFDRLDRDVVLKPLFGSEGRGLTRLTDRDLLVRAVRMLEQLGAVIYLQRFIPHAGFDTRVMVIGDQTLAMRRFGHGDWRTNISRGGRGDPHTATNEEIELARAAADLVGASIAGVDLLRGNDGRLYVLEVNAVPGWKALASVTGQDVAGLILNFIRRQVASRAL